MGPRRSSWSGVEKKTLTDTEMPGEVTAWYQSAGMKSADPAGRAKASGGAQPA